jgi:GNAT superfamily N-acetyltransferase
VLTIRPARDEDLPAVAALLEAGFSKFIAQDYDRTGRIAFRMYAAERAIWSRLRDGALGLVGCMDERVIAYAEIQGRGRVMKGRDHLSLLFVDAAFQRQGVARQLVGRILATLRALPRPPQLLTVNAAPRAVPAYVRLGFRATGPERMIDGIRAVPMIIAVGTTKRSVPIEA